MGPLLSGSAQRSQRTLQGLPPGAPGRKPGGENEAASAAASIPQPHFRASLSFLGFRTCFSKERSGKGGCRVLTVAAAGVGKNWRRSGVVSGVPGGMETSEEKQRDSVSGFLPEEGN